MSPHSLVLLVKELSEESSVLNSCQVGDSPTQVQFSAVNAEVLFIQGSTEIRIGGTEFTSKRWRGSLGPLIPVGSAL